MRWKKQQQQQHELVNYIRSEQTFWSTCCFCFLYCHHSFWITYSGIFQWKNSYSSWNFQTEWFTVVLSQNGYVHKIYIRCVRTGKRLNYTLQIRYRFEFEKFEIVFAASVYYYYPLHWKLFKIWKVERLSIEGHIIL